MKGVVFTEFLEMVEDNFGMEVADRIIEDSNLPTEGVYTSVGTYDHDELLRMVGHLSCHVDTPVSDLVCTYGNHLFGRFAVGHRPMFEGVHSAYEMLAHVEDHIHAEVRKLYPDAELPTFACEQPDEATFIMEYRSSRPFASLAEGLIRGCIAHFGEPIDLVREDIDPDGRHSRFRLTRTV